MEQQAEWFGMQMLGQEVCRIGVANSVGEPIAAWEACEGTPIGGMPFARTRSYQDRVQEDDKGDEASNETDDAIHRENTGDLRQLIEDLRESRVAESSTQEHLRQLLENEKRVTQELRMELRERVRELEKQQQRRNERDNSRCC